MAKLEEMLTQLVALDKEVIAYFLLRKLNKYLYIYI